VSFSPEELERYARHIVLHEIGGAGQRRLAAARLLVVGAGGLGSPALLYLAAAGIGRLTVVDDDAVSLSNLQRQVIHGTPDIGRPKVESAAAAIVRLNPHVETEGLAFRLDAESAAALVPGHDLVLDGSDTFETRHLVNAACVAAGVPLLAAAMGPWEGQISLWHPAGGGPCYACVFPEPPAPDLVPTCASAGIIGALAGVMGAMMALEAVKALTGAGTGLRGTLLLYDALHAETRRIRLRRRPDCPVCGYSHP
jgi:molybdopterin/thiamine biosynthesis adenylyltransferase